MLWSLLGSAAGIYACLALFMYFFQSNLVYFPDPNLIATPARVGLPYEDVSISTEDGETLHGWLVKADNATNVVLFFHGNAGNISHRLESLQIFHQLGLSTLIIDYRGYGQSTGRPSEDGTYRDADAAWRYLTENLEFEPRRVVIFGRSMGGGVASWLAARHLPAALILESTFTSVPDLGARIYPIMPVRLLARIHYDTAARLPRIKCPVLVSHGPDDEVVPVAHGHALYSAASEPKSFLELRGGHNGGFLLARQDYRRGLAEFLETVGAAGIPGQ